MQHGFVGNLKVNQMTKGHRVAFGTSVVLVFLLGISYCSSVQLLVFQSLNSPNVSNRPRLHTVFIYLLFLDDDEPEVRVKTVLFWPPLFPSAIFSPSCQLPLN